MDLKKALISELKHEAANTRKLLELVPEDKFDWQPHEKSMSLIRLAAHIANLGNWTSMTIETDELDIGGPFKPFVPASREELLRFHDEAQAHSEAALETAAPELFMKPWTLKKNGAVIMELPKAAIIRSMCFNHVIHHRGQLSVYLRLLDVPIPGMYGPSADDRLAEAAAQA